jgi:ABC-type dipeptide/oligopeptide/nickel transport system permease subunit
MKTLSTDFKTDSRSENLWLVALRRLFRQRSGIAGMIILGSLTLMAVFAPVIAPYDPIQVLIGIEPVKKRADPCIHLLGCPKDQPQHLMGIDGNVRDEFSRIIYGTRISLFIGFVTIGVAVIVGTILGAIAGYAGGWVSDIIMRVLDVVLAFPFLLLAIAIVAVLGPGLTNAMMHSLPACFTQCHLSDDRAGHVGYWHCHSRDGCAFIYRDGCPTAGS